LKLLSELSFLPCLERETKILPFFGKNKHSNTENLIKRKLTSPLDNTDSSVLEKKETLSNLSC